VKPKKRKTTTTKSKRKKSTFDISDYVADSNIEETIEESEESTGELKQYESFIAQTGDNVLMILPGRSSTEGKTMVFRIFHGMEGRCARKTKEDRFEKCAVCDYWFNNFTRKAELEAGKPPHACQRWRPQDKGVVNVIDMTWACEHRRIRKGSEVIERLKSEKIDYRRLRKRPCFLDKDEFDKDSDKCKACPAFKSCFQGPQKLALSMPRAQELLTEQNRIGSNKKVTVNGSKVPMRGNISLAWHIIHGKKKLAEKVAFPLIYNKTVDPKLPKQFGTKYKVTFSREALVLPLEWQKRALMRAGDLAEYHTAISFKESKQALKVLKNSADEEDGKPDCFDDASEKDGEHCDGEGCPHYDECAIDGGKKKKKKKKKKGKKTKQDSAIEDMSDIDDDDDDVDSIIAKMKSGMKK